MSHWLLINPTAGGGRGEKLGNKIAAYLTQRGLTVTLHLTQSAEHLQSLAVEAVSQKATGILVAGGDGSISLVINALFGQCDTTAIKQTPVGLIPVGTGNDFIKAAGIPKSWQAACDVVIQQHTNAIDIGQLDVHKARGDITTPTCHFINNVASGFDAQVGISAKKIPLLKGQILYVLALFYHLLKGSRQNLSTLRFSHNSKEIADFHGPLALAAVSNGVCYGGAFNIAPEAKLDDGVFDVVIGEWQGRLTTLQIVLQLLKAEHMKSKHVHGWQCNGVTVTTTDPIPLVTDGELVHDQVYQYQVTLLPRALQLYWPRTHEATVK